MQIQSVHFSARRPEPKPKEKPPEDAEGSKPKDNGETKPETAEGKFRRRTWSS